MGKLAATPLSLFLCIVLSVQQVASSFKNITRVWHSSPEILSTTSCLWGWHPRSFIIWLLACPLSHLLLLPADFVFPLCTKQSSAFPSSGPWHLLLPLPGRFVPRHIHGCQHDPHTMYLRSNVRSGRPLASHAWRKGHHWGKISINSERSNS